MLGRSNFVVLVGGGRNPRFPGNKVIIYDHRSGQYMAELEFRSEVRAVRVRKDRLVVVLRSKIFVYTLGPNPVKLAAYETADNPLGLCCLSFDEQKALLVFLARQEGHVHIVDLYQEGSLSLVRAHKTRLAALSLNPDGTKFATASKKGTLVRVFSTETGKIESELRRGSDRAVIFSIAFSFDNQRICVASDKGTVHVFQLDKQDIDLDLSEEEEPTEHKSAIPNVKELLPKYFNSKWSFASFKLNDPHFIAIFGAEKNSVIAISTEGHYYKYTFDLAKGGECIRQCYNKYLQIGEMN